MTKISQYSMPHRMLFLDQLRQACTQIGDGHLGLILLDIKGFVRINAAFGFEAGDELLQAITVRLRTANIKGATIERIGNDEFGVLLRQLQAPQFITLAAHKILRVLAEPFSIGERVIRVSVNMGLDVADTRSAQPERMLRLSEDSLYKAKMSGKPFLPFDKTKHEEAHDWRLESELIKSMESNDLELYYQPKLHLATGLPLAAEALGRWPHPERGIIGPMRFVPMLEQSGAIYDYTKWAIHTALRQISEWPNLGADFSVSVNVSASVLEEPEFPSLVAAALNIWGAKPNSLILEITEGAIIQEEHTSFESLKHLKELGLRLSIDDFGTGYSCLAYFKNLPADELKIDKSFIDNMIKDQEDQHLVQVMIQLGKRFGHQVVAEGIEDQATFDLLKELGCDYIQGYHVAKPMPHAAYVEWLQQFQ